MSVPPEEIGDPKNTGPLFAFTFAADHHRINTQIKPGTFVSINCNGVPITKR
jgi:hypothetical protein